MTVEYLRGYNLDASREDVVPRCKTFVVIPLLVVFSGCFVGDILGGGNQSELDENRDKWRDAAIASYTFRQDRSCFCGFAGPADVTVMNGEIVSVRSFWPEPTDVAPDNFNVFDTIDGLFNMVDDAIDRNAHSLDVTYDEQLGFPTIIAIDFLENAIDDEITVTATGLTPISN